MATVLYNNDTQSHDSLSIMDSPNADLVSNTNLLQDISFYCANVMVTFCLIGIVGNCISVYIFTRKTMRSSINILLTGLSCIDLCLLIVIVPIFAVPPLNVQGNARVQEFCHVLVVYVYPLSMILQTSSVWLFLLITAERFLAVCMPLKVRIYCSQFRARLAILAILLLSTGYNLIRFWEYKLVETGLTGEDEPGITSIPRIREDPVYWLWYGTVLYLLTQFLLPFVTMAVLNGVMTATILAAKRRRASLTSSERSEHKTALMMVLVIVVFVCCYALSFLLNFLEYVDPDWSQSAMGFMLNDISNTLITFNSAVTWLIYTIFSRRYRQWLRWLPFKLTPNFILKQLFSEETFMQMSLQCNNGTLEHSRTSAFVARRSFGGGGNLLCATDRAMRFNELSRRSPNQPLTSITLARSVNDVSENRPQDTNQLGPDKYRPSVKCSLQPKLRPIAVSFKEGNAETVPLRARRRRSSAELVANDAQTKEVNGGRTSESNGAKSPTSSSNCLSADTAF